MRTENTFSILISLLLCIALFSACSASASGNISDNASAITAGSSSTETASNISGISDSVRFESEDHYFDWKSQSYQTVDMAKGSSTIGKSGIYEITGTLQNGSLIVDVNHDADTGIVYLVLNNASISSATSAPIYIMDAKKVVLILENGTANTIYQGSGCVTDENNDPSAAVFSKADLSITGEGTLQVTSDFNDGITGKDDLKITGGTIIVEAKADGIVGKDVLAIETCSMTISAGKDGMRSTNETDAGMGSVLIAGGTFDIAATSDAIQAYGTLQIDGGTFELTTGGGYSENASPSMNNGFGGKGGPMQGTVTQTDTESKKGLKATGGIVINDGNFIISSYDDSLHSAGDIAIAGGTFTLKSGDAGIHSDAGVTLNGGTIAIQNSYEGIEGTNITVNGGKIDLVSSDDGFNVNASSGLLTINGGEISVNAGGDGTDSNGSIKMTGGTVYVDGPTSSGNGAIDYNSSFTISGGTIIASGSSGMAECPTDDSGQPSILMYYSTAQAAGTAIVLKDKDGNTVASFTPQKQYSSAAISAPDMKVGESYTLYSSDVKVVSFTISGTVTYLNESGVTTGQSQAPGGMGGGMQGGRGPQGGGMRGGNGTPGGNLPQQSN